MTFKRFMRFGKIRGDIVRQQKRTLQKERSEETDRLERTESN